MIRAIAIWLMCMTVANAQYLVEQPQDAIPTWAERFSEGALSATSEEPKIVMETIENCPACKVWLRTDGIDLLEKGWLLKVDKVTPSEGRTYPRWRVCFRDGCSVIEYTRQFKQRLQAVIDSRKQR